MDVKDTGSTPVYHPRNANEKSANKETKERGGRKKGKTGGPLPTKERGGNQSIYAEAKETKLSAKKIGESENVKWERSGCIHNGRRAHIARTCSSISKRGGSAGFTRGEEEISKREI